MITLSVLWWSWPLCALFYLWLSRFWLVYQLDVKTVFLRGTLTEMYCNQQIVFVDSAHSNIVCKLNKSLYDLSRHPEFGMVTLPPLSRWTLLRLSRTHPCLSMAAVVTLCLLLYVDNIVLTTSSPALATHYLSIAAGVCYEGSESASLFLGHCS